MKIVTWNCDCSKKNSSFNKKYHLLDQFDADLLVVQECENPEYLSEECREWIGGKDKYLWIGDDNADFQTKDEQVGISIFARKQNKIERLDWNCKNLYTFLPFRINDSINVVAVWSKNTQKNSKFKEQKPQVDRLNYVKQIRSFVDLHRSKLVEEPAVLCGDFNSNTKWDYKYKSCSHSDLVKELENLNIKSLYHFTQNEKQGAELIATQYQYRKIDKPYHIDYVFASTKLIQDSKESVYVGDPAYWLKHSDHMPLVVEINIES